jgi:hypothetical protein
MTLGLIEKIAEKKAELQAIVAVSYAADQDLLHTLTTEIERLGDAGFTVTTNVTSVRASNQKCEVRCFVEGGVIKIDGRSFEGASPFAVKRVVDPEAAVEIIADHIARYG